MYLHICPTWMYNSTDGVSKYQRQCLDSQIKSPLKAWLQLDQLEAGLLATTVYDSAG